MASTDEKPDDAVRIPIPFGLTGQWLQQQRRQKGDHKFEKNLGIGLNDWEGRWWMLHWITQRVIDDFAVASQTPRSYERDVALEYHLTFWFLTGRLCYDTIAFIAVQMAAEQDRGKLSGMSFNDLAKKERPSLRGITNSLLTIVREARDTFKELRYIRDSLTHFVGKAGGSVEPPKRINIDIRNDTGLHFTVETSRFADLYGTVETWPVVETLRRHFRCIYETPGKLECCFLNHVAEAKLAGAFQIMHRTMFEFLDGDKLSCESHDAWLKKAEDDQAPQPSP